MVADAAVNVAVHPMEYSPPLMLMGTAVLMPDMAMVPEVRKEPGGTFGWIRKANTSGVVSQARVVTLKVRGAPAMTTVAVVVVLQVAAEVWRSVTVWPLLMVPATVVNAPASI